ncbi:MAG: anthranilate synthase component I [Rhodospirillaceae bacterium]|nr:anthranilate synthase component I [Rhodospirillaceae bacterium]
MQVIPDFETFHATYESGKPQLVWMTLPADLETPVSVMMKLADGRPNSFLLESVEGGAVRGRYSFVGLNPDIIWRCQGNVADINRQARFTPDAFETEKTAPLDSLRALIAESRVDIPDGLPPMAAGLVGYMGYDTIRLVEDIPCQNPDTLHVPDGLFVRPTLIAVFDTIADTLTLVTPVRPEANVAASVAFDHARERLADALSNVGRSLPYQRPVTAMEGSALPVSNMSRDDFKTMVARGKEYILAGDIFQVVLSQRFAVPFDLPPFALYRALRRTNPSPFMFFLNFGSFHVVGASPEILVRMRDGIVTIRPIAGTAPRGKDKDEDAALAKSLLADPKERAEHLMLLDLGRNDVGRVAEIGSVTVTEQMVLEYYSHVMHIVSNVDGRIRADCDAMDALMAGFPAGTVSGAPKVRAMEIIDELEPVKRCIYAGCIGYISGNGDMDTCIALRTAVVKDNTMYVQAGGGIVADSDPDKEFEESRNKARALLRAAEVAPRYAR